jgi:phosphate transport system substrate-binding protein
MRRQPQSAIVFVLLALFSSLLSCTAVPTPRANVRLTLIGADAMQPLANALADAYAQRHPNVAFTIRQGNSETGLRAANEISGTVGLVSRVVKPEELNGTRAVVVARDGIAIIVNSKNPINAIMRSQIAEVFSGKVSIWPTGPNAGKMIAVVSREAGSGTRAAFEAMVMQGERVTRTAVLMPNEAAVVDYVANNPAAIGYCSMSALAPGVQPMMVDDVPLSLQNVENEKYPLVRTLAFIVPLAAAPDIEDFVGFALGAEGQRIVAQKYGRAQ